MVVSQTVCPVGSVAEGLKLCGMTLPRNVFGSDATALPVEHWWRGGEEEML